MKAKRALVMLLIGIVCAGLFLVAPIPARAVPPPDHYYPFEGSLNDTVGAVNGSPDGGGVGFDVDRPGALGHSAASLDLDGSSFVHINNAVIPSSGPFTISYWFVSDQTDGTIFDMSQGDKHFYSSIYVTAGGGVDQVMWAYESSDDSDVQWRYQEDPGVLELGEWHHVAALGTYSGSTLPQPYLYLDGMPANLDDVTLPTSAKAAFSDFALGEGKGIKNPRGNLDGRIDDLAIWHQELTPADIVALAAGAPPVDPAFNWNTDASGFFHDGANWDKGTAPDGLDHDVNIIRGAADPTVTYDATSGTRTVKSLATEETLVVSGGDLTVIDTLTVGAAGTVEMSGGALTTGGLDNSAGGTLMFSGGALTVDGGTFDPGVADYHLGSDGGDPELTLTNGAQLSLDNLGVAGDEFPATLNLSGAGTTLTVTGGVAIGFVDLFWGPGEGEVTVTDGAQVSSNGLYVSSKSGLFPSAEAGLGILTISGAGSEWIAGDTQLGVDSDKGGALVIQDGGRLESSGARLEPVNPSDTFQVWIDGAGSEWVINGDLEAMGTVRYLTPAIRITNGAGLRNAKATINPRYDHMSYDAVWVGGTGSTWTCTGGLTVSGIYGFDWDTRQAMESAIIMIKAGAALDTTAGDSCIGEAPWPWDPNDGVYGGWPAPRLTTTMVVDGAGSTWQADTLTIGRYGDGDLWVRDGGAVVSGTCMMAMYVDVDYWPELGHHPYNEVSGPRLYDSLGAAAVEGGDADSSWTVNGSLYVGGTDTTVGGEAVVDVLSGGTVEVSGTIKIWETGTVNLYGGTLTADTIDNSAGGTFDFESGTLSVGTFLGVLVCSGDGTISPGASPGTMTVDGDLIMSGGSILIEIGGYGAGTDYDRLIVTGDTLLEGTTVIFAFIDGFAPAQDDVFGILTIGGQAVTDMMAYEVRNLLPGFEYEVELTGGALSMTALNNGHYVPEPAGLGLIGLAMLAARKRRQ